MKGHSDLCWVGRLALGPNACPEDAGSPLRRLSVDRDDDGEDGDDGGGEDVDMV